MAIYHHHHIHFRALFSSTEGWAFWQVFLEGVLSTQNGPEGQQNPYLASFCHSQALHPMISLACQIFSVQPHSACVLLQSSLCCALHVQTRATEILKSKSVRSTNDVIDAIQTWVRQSQIVTKTLHFHANVYQKLIIFLIQSNSNLL